MPQSNSYGPPTLAELCEEAVQHCGDDWHRILAYVADRIASMPGGDQDRLVEDVSRILSFWVPPRSDVLH